jgi:hypothetical protein
MIIVLAYELIEAQNLRTSVSAHLCASIRNLIDLADQEMSAPLSSHAKAPFRLAGTVNKPQGIYILYHLNANA